MSYLDNLAHSVRPSHGVVGGEEHAMLVALHYAVAASHVAQFLDKMLRMSEFLLI